MIIPAAGVGSRLQSSRPKVLSEVLGRTMLDHLLALYEPWISNFVVVVHPSFADAVSERIGQRSNVAIARQAAPTGMLDAILVASDAVRETRADDVWITWCDQVAVHPATVTRLATLREERPEAVLAFPTCRRSRPYIHLERSTHGRIVRVLHEREGDAMPAVGESDIGLFALSAEAYVEWLPEFARVPADGGTATGERNFLPFIPWAAARGDVSTFTCRDEMEAVGVNTPDDLRRVEEYLSARAVGGDDATSRS